MRALSPLAINFHKLARQLHQERVLTLTRFRVGDRVAIARQWGQHIAAAIPATVERIDLDHDHVGGCRSHSEACYCAARVELTLAWGAKPDGTAALRCRTPLKQVYAVKGAA